jgi:hypothetical protein
VPEGGEFALCTACRQAVIFQTLLVGVNWAVPRDATNLLPIVLFSWPLFELFRNIIELRIFDQN